MLKQYFYLRMKSFKIRLFLLVLALYDLIGFVWPGFLHHTELVSKASPFISNINNFFSPTIILLLGLFILLLTRDTYQYFTNISVLTRMRTHKRAWYCLALILFIESFFYVVFLYFLIIVRALYYHDISDCILNWQGLLQCMVLQTVGYFFWMLLLGCAAELSRSQIIGFCVAFLIMVIDYVAGTVRNLQTFSIQFIAVYPGCTDAFGYRLVFVLVVALLTVQLFSYLVEARDDLSRQGSELR